MTKAEVMKLVACALAAFPNMQAKEREPLYEVWHMVLQHDSYAEAQVALAKVLEECEFFPPVAKIKKALRGIKSSHHLPAAEAWGEVMDAVSRIGYCGIPRWSSGLIKRCIEALGGWQAFCGGTNLEADRAHFMRFYGELVEQAKEEESLPPAYKALRAQYRQDLARDQIKALPSPAENLIIDMAKRRAMPGA